MGEDIVNMGVVANGREVAVTAALTPKKLEPMTWLPKG